MVSKWSRKWKSRNDTKARDDPKILSLCGVYVFLSYRGVQSKFFVSSDTPIPLNSRKHSYMRKCYLWSKEHFPKYNQEWCAINSKLRKVITKIRSSVFISHVTNNKSKILVKNYDKQYRTKVLFSSFQLNGHTLGFCPEK